MHSHTIENFTHSHHFLGEQHERNERKTWAVIAIRAFMMVAEIVGGLLFGSLALIADGIHILRTRGLGAEKPRRARHGSRPKRRCKMLRCSAQSTAAKL
jgi:hypothetical protein